MEEDPDAYLILKLRAEILELGSAIRQLQRAGLDDAAAQLLISRKRAQLEQLVKTNSANPGINLLIGEWKAAGGGDVLPDVRDRVRLRLVKSVGTSARAISRR